MVGRESELDRIANFFDSEGGPLALWLEGAAGIGKTTLWRASVEFGRERQYRVLACQPTAAETAYSFAALGDLLAHDIADVLVDLPLQQRHALEAALGLASEEGATVSQHLICVAFLSVLRLLAATQPVLVAVDDLQWLDPPSAAALQFAARRFATADIKLLVATRREGDVRPLQLERNLAQNVLRVEVGPLSLGALHRLLLSRLGEPLSRPTLRKVHESSGGNPFYALEIAQFLLDRGPTLQPAEPLPIPRRLDELVHARLERLPPTVKSILEAASLLAEPTLTTLAAATEVDAEGDALDRAVATGVIELDGDRVRFIHPLLAAAVVSGIGPQRRRRIHARLAQIVIDPEEQARHLALGSEAADAEVAGSLEEAAQHAALRGAPLVAAELAELAAQHTPKDDRRACWRRLIEAGLRYATAGDLGHARALLEPLADEIPPGRVRAEVLLNLADFRWNDAAAGIELCERALAHVGSDDSLRARIHMLLSSRALEAEAAGSALSHVRTAHEAAGRSGDDELALLALVNLVHTEVCVGEMTPGLFERALACVSADAARRARIPHFESPQFVLGLALTGLGRFEEARTLFENARADSLNQGVPFSAACADEFLAEVECRLGNWRQAELHAAECSELYEQLGMEDAPQRLYASALVDAHLGNVDKARLTAERGAAIASDAGQEFWALANRRTLGFLELSLGNATRAVEYLQPPKRAHVMSLLHMPSNCDFIETSIEAVVAVGELDAAAELLGALHDRSKRIDSAWERAIRARSQGLLSSAQGDYDRALAAFGEALLEHKRLHTPFERARTLLALGGLQRRLRQRRAARETLEHALAVFEELGARLWAQRARTELKRIAGRTPAGDVLTPTEQRVADLVAEGHTNKEIAATLFVTVKAVEANLTRVYAKLGVHSRTELARLLVSKSSVEETPKPRTKIRIADV